MALRENLGPQRLRATGEVVAFKRARVGIASHSADCLPRTAAPMGVFRDAFAAVNRKRC